MKKLLAASLVLLSLSACGSPTAGDAFVPTYSGWARVNSAAQYKDSCEVGIYMLKNGLNGHYTHVGRCTESKNQMIYMIFGKKV